MNVNLPPPLLIEITNTAAMIQLVGSDDTNLRYIEKKAFVHIKRRGNILSILGDETSQKKAYLLIRKLFNRVTTNAFPVTQEMTSMIDTYLRFPDINTNVKGDSTPKMAINAAGTTIKPRSQKQQRYIQSLRNNLLVFSIGPAGTGKTWLAVAQAVSLLLSGGVDKIILSRPAVEAGEQLGFLPGDLKEKIDPYLQPLYDALHSMLPKEDIERRMASGEIEIAPLAFMRGRTLSHAFVILDEAQNTTISQMKMFLTRFGEGSRMVVTGDLTQIDLPRGSESGLRDAMLTLKDIPQIDRIEFSSQDVVRHPLVATIVDAYEKREKKHLKQTTTTAPQ